MPALTLTIKSFKPFEEFSGLSSQEELAFTWKVCTKAKGALEDGNRLENLSWRLWNCQNTLSVPSKEFKKLSLKPLSDYVANSTKQESLKSENPVENTLESTLSNSSSIQNLLAPLNDAESVYSQFELQDFESHFNFENLTDFSMDVFDSDWTTAINSSTDPSTRLIASNASETNLSAFPTNMPNHTPNLPTIFNDCKFNLTPQPETMASVHLTKVMSIETPASRNCINCNNSTETPSWSSMNVELYCVACSLYLNFYGKHRPLPSRKAVRPKGNAPCTCTNCQTQTTSLWRRDDHGYPLCNACGLFAKLHGKNRPISMKSDVIYKRKRYLNGEKSKKPKKK